MSDWNTVLNAIVEHRSAGHTPGVSVTSFNMSGEQQARGVVHATIRLLRDILPPVDVEELRAKVGEKVSLLSVGETMMGSPVVSTIAGTLFATPRGLALLPKGRRKHGFGLEPMLNKGHLLAVAPGYPGEQSLAALVHATRAALPEVAPLTQDRLGSLPRVSNQCTLAVFGTYPFIGARIPGCIWFIHEYSGEDDIIENYLLVPDGYDATSEHGSCYGSQLLAMDVGEVVGFEPIPLADVFDLTYDQAMDRLRLSAAVAS